MFAILKKEFKSYFLSPIGYVVIGIFLFVFSVFFYLTVISSPFRSIILLYSIIWINNYCTDINNENVCRRKKVWNRAININITSKYGWCSIWKIYSSNVCNNHNIISIIYVFLYCKIFWRT